VSKFWERRTVGPIKAIHPATGKVIEVDPQKDAFIGSDLHLSLRRLPGLLSWYFALRDRAETRLREAKHAEHNAEEDAYAELRERNPKVTETTIKMAVRKDPRMRKAFRERMDAEDMHEKLKSAAETFIQKGYALTNLTNIYKVERSSKDNA
jgi:hypothetical protein